MDALERDFYEERRRKWRRSAFWRGFLVAAVLAAIVAAWLGSGALEAARRQIARVEVTGARSWPRGTATCWPGCSPPNPPLPGRDDSATTTAS